MSINESFNAPTDKYPTVLNAKRARDVRARELRKQGYFVVTQKWDLSDLARVIRFTLTAVNK